MKLKNILIPFIIILWILFIILGYFFDVHINSSEKDHGLSRIKSWEMSPRKSHRYYFEAVKQNFNGKNEDGLGSPISPAVSIIIIILGIYSLLTMHQKRMSKKMLELNLSPISFAGIFIGVFLINYFFWLSFHKQLNLREIIPINFFQSLLQALLILMVTLSLGKKAKVVIIPASNEDDLKDFLVSMGLGIVIITFLLFLLGIFGFLTKLFVLFLFLIILIISRKEFIFWIKGFIKPAHVKLRFTHPTIFLFLIFLVFLSFNFLSIARPIPLGHDGLEAYMNTSHLLSTGGRLLSGINFYPCELFVSSTFVLFNNAMPAMILFSSFGILVFLSIFLLGKLYCQKRGLSKGSYYPMLIATLFYTLPAVTYQLSNDNKVDLAALFFACLSMIAFWEWKDGDILSKKKCRILLISWFFIGMTVAIKLTFVFFAAILFLDLLFLLIRKNISLKNKLILGLMCFLFFVLPILPFAIKNDINIINNKGKWHVSSLLTGFSESPRILFTEDERRIESLYKQVFINNSSAELDRYAGFQQGLSKYLKLPFITTFNLAQRGQYVDIGFIFLSFVPIIIFQLKWIRKNNEKDFGLLVIIAISNFIYWIIWAIYARGIIWYSFPGIILLLFLLIEVINASKRMKMRLVSPLLNTVLILWFILDFFFRTSYLPVYGVSVKNTTIAYASGSLTDQEYLEQVVPSFNAVSKIVNGHIEKGNGNQPKIYLVGKYTKYFIKQNNKLVYQDNDLSAYITLSEKKTDEQTVTRLKENGFRYIIVDPNSLSFFGDDKAFLYEKLRKLVNLVKNNPNQVRILVNDPMNGMILAEIN